MSDYALNRLGQGGPLLPLTEGLRRRDTVGQIRLWLQVQTEAISQAADAGFGDAYSTCT